MALHKGLEYCCIVWVIFFHISVRQKDGAQIIMQWMEDTYIMRQEGLRGILENREISNFLKPIFSLS